MGTTCVHFATYHSMYAYMEIIYGSFLFKIIMHMRMIWVGCIEVALNIVYIKRKYTTAPPWSIIVVHTRIYNFRKEH